MLLESQRKETPFAARDNMLDIWKHATELSFRGFGRKKRKMPKEPKNFEKWSEESREKWRIKQMFKSWIANFCQYMSKKQIEGIILLYRKLFGNNLDKWLMERNIYKT